LIRPVARGIQLTLLSAGILVMSAPLAVAKQTHDVKIQVWPAPKYPMLASWLRLQGHCDVRFSVDEKGYPFAVSPSCTRPIFCFEAKRAVAAAEFDPKRVGGVPQVRSNIVIPLEFSFEGSGYELSKDQRALKPCEQVAVS